MNLARPTSNAKMPSLFRGKCRLGLFLCLAQGLFASLNLHVRAQECAVPVRKEGKIPGRPLILYTDLQSGPTSGGEKDQGVYLSIFGRNFGESLSTDSQSRAKHPKVSIGGHPVANYRYLGTSGGRPDVEQITVQVGRLGGASMGKPLAVEIEVDGRRSNSDHTFTPNPGNIYFVDNVNGNDATAKVGDISHPFKHVQTHDIGRSSLWPLVQPGDVVVMRGGRVAWQDTGIDGYFLRFQASGTETMGRAGSGPITIMGYPGEDVFINETYSASSKGAIAARSAGPLIPQDSKLINGQHSDPNICEQSPQLYCSQWIVIADLRVEGGGKDGAIDLETGGNHWRIVNNILSASTASASARSGGIAGDGLDAVILGNTVRDINSPDPGLQNHGIYIDGPGSYRVEYNYIHDVRDGSGFQIYGDQTATGSFTTDNVIFSHNWIDHVRKYCINFADNSAGRLTAFDNVLAYCGMAGLRLNSELLHGAKVYNNTFYAADNLAGDHFGAIVIDSKLKDHAIEVRNNIFIPWHRMPYMGGDAALTGTGPSALFTNNLYFGGIGTPAFEANAQVIDPYFVAADSCDFHVALKSHAVGRGAPQVNTVVRDDFDSDPIIGPYDIGAYRAH